ncbi:MAG: hypothetical protein ABEK12_01510, partial [Candidatus Nanohaloarchaea archaeon]
NETGDITLNQSMTLVTSDNTSALYEYTYTPEPDVQGGDGTATGDNGSSVLDSMAFYLAAPAPDIFEISVTPAFRVPGDTVTLVANISDSEEDIDDVTASINGSTYTLSQTDSYREGAVYEVSFQVNSSGTVEYTVTAADSNGTTDTVDGTFTVYPEAHRRSESTTINITVPSKCVVSIVEFQTPGEISTELGVTILGWEQIGSFYIRMANTGSLQANLTAQLNVTYENETRWEPGNPIGNVTNSYNRTNYTLEPVNNPNSSGEYSALFNGTLRGWYTG